MSLLFFERISERVRIAREESDMSYFMSLLYAGEHLTKVVTLFLLSGIEGDKAHSKYNLLYRVVRADGVGDWANVIEEIVLGPTSNYLRLDFRKFQKEFTIKVTSEDWQYEAVDLIKRCLTSIGEEVEEGGLKVSLKTWFAFFARFRNKTRGHGIIKSANIQEVCLMLDTSISLIQGRASIFEVECAYLSQNLSGMYRVIPISGTTQNFKYLKTREYTRSLNGNKETYPPGVYIFVNSPMRVELIETDVDLSDFYIPNGNFATKRYEVLSYITGDKGSKDNSRFLTPVADLPASETQGAKTLEVFGNVFTNLPKFESLYIRRKVLEDELRKILIDERHPVVTLVGRGGIGKTSLALSVLRDLCSADRFAMILWFSARDIDLLQEGAKSVQPHVLDIDDIAKEFTRLIAPNRLREKGFEPKKFIEQELGKCSVGPLLFVLDNFETVKNYYELFNWFDTFIRVPNKILITSRFRDFKADYPINVGGLNFAEFEELVDSLANEFSILHLIDQEYLNELYSESGGHPYITKILIGEISKERKPRRVRRIIASQDEVLTVLFERIFASLSVPARRVFLTLCAWKSVLPQIGIESVLKSNSDEAFNVEEAIEELFRYSLVDFIRASIDDSVFVFVPVSAFFFGQKKLSVNPMKSVIEKDLEFLKLFGVGQSVHTNKGVKPRIDAFIKQVALIVSTRKNTIQKYEPIIEYLCRRNYKSYLTFSVLYDELGDVRKSISCCQKFLENEQDDNRKIAAWKKLSALYRKEGDAIGEAQALIEMCVYASTSFETVSTSVKRINELVSKNKFEITNEERLAIVRRMTSIFDGRLKDGTGDSDDYSQLAWLNLHIKNKKEAIQIVRGVLSVDPNHYHCLNLAAKLNLKVD